MSKPYCCVINCPQPPKWLVQADQTDLGIALFDSYTHSCSDHVQEFVDDYQPAPCTVEELE